MSCESIDKVPKDSGAEVSITYKNSRQSPIGCFLAVFCTLSFIDLFFFDTMGLGRVEKYSIICLGKGTKI